MLVSVLVQTPAFSCALIRPYVAFASLLRATS
jgi:hypothetical protein